MAQQSHERVMISERIAPGMLPRVLNTTDMTIIFLAIVLFVVQASVIQPAGPSAYVYWLLGFLLFLIPGAIVTAQLGQMFPQEGSLYVWTQKALGPFWGFFAGFCAWWPGVLVMVATSDLVVTIWQFIDTGSLSKTWEQMLVILAVLWFSAFMSLMRLRVTQTYANLVVFFYGAAIFVIGLAGVLWLVGGNKSANSFSGVHNWIPDGSNWTLFGLVILSLLGRVNEQTNVAVNAVLLQTTIASIFAIITFGPWAQHGNFPSQVYLIFQAGVTVIWCLSMILLFADVFLVRRAYPEKFQEMRVASTPVLALCGIVGIGASIVGAVVTFKDPWNPEIFSVGTWRIWLAIVAGVAALAAVVIYLISEFTHRHELGEPTTTPAA